MEASWPDIPEDVAIDVMPASNGEYAPKPPTRQQIAIMLLQDEKIEHSRRRFNMDRRSFVRIAAAYTIGISATNTVADLASSRPAVTGGFSTDRFRAGAVRSQLSDRRDEGCGCGRGNRREFLVR